MRAVRPWLSLACAVAVTGAFVFPCWAADVCGETVPAIRVIDGIPAYAQCAASMNAAIYSNDGVNTATAAADSAWVRTQRSGGYQCTELAHRYLRFRFGITAVPNGDAGVWCDAALPAGLEKSTTPVHGDLIVLAPGSCNADATTGHVAVVDNLSPDMTSVMAVQQNSANRARYNVTCAACFLHATANTGGSSADAGVGDASRPDAGISDRPDGGAGDGAGADGPPGTSGGTGGGGGPATDGGSGGPGTGGREATGGSAGAMGGSGATGAAGTAGTAGVTGDGASGGCTLAGAADAASWSTFLFAALVAALAVRRRRRG